MSLIQNIAEAKSCLETRKHLPPVGHLEMLILLATSGRYVTPSSQQRGRQDKRSRE